MYKHNIDLAIAKIEQFEKHSLKNELPLHEAAGELEITGVVHEDYSAGPLIPFLMKISGENTSDDIGSFVVELIQPHNDPEYPEETKSGYLSLEIFLNDSDGRLRAALIKAMEHAAASNYRFLHVRLLKPETDTEPKVRELETQQYTGATKISSLIITDAIQLAAPKWAYAWNE